MPIVAVHHFVIGIPPAQTYSITRTDSLGARVIAEIEASPAGCIQFFDSLGGRATFQIQWSGGPSSVPTRPPAPPAPSAAAHHGWLWSTWHWILGLFS